MYFRRAGLVRPQGLIRFVGLVSPFVRLVGRGGLSVVHEGLFVRGAQGQSPGNFSSPA